MLGDLGDNEQTAKYFSGKFRIVNNLFLWYDARIRLCLGLLF